MLKSVFALPLSLRVLAFVVVFTGVVRKVGTYVLHCAVFCGAGRANMTLTVNVVK